MKAGIQPDDRAFPEVWEIDSRPSTGSGQAFRGNDWRAEGGPIPNDTTTKRLAHSEACAMGRDVAMSRPGYVAPAKRRYSRSDSAGISTQSV